MGRWNSLLHKGVLLRQSYTPHNIPVICDGKSRVLNAIHEEPVTLYAKYVIMYGQPSDNFISNFTKTSGIDFDISKCNLGRINKYIKKQTELNRQDKAKKKKLIQKQIISDFSKAIVDNRVQPIAGILAEPSSIFIGRGDHPLAGSYRRQLTSKDITINVTKGNVPKVSTLIGNSVIETNETWGGIRHDKDSRWIASWLDPVTKKRKYIWLTQDSEFKKGSDKQKFDLAIRLKKGIKRVRKKILKLAQSNIKQKKQIGTILFLIDKLGLRVGSKKKKDTVDTVGVSTLKVKNIKILSNQMISLSFIGKDTIRYTNKFHVPLLIYNNLGTFINNKTKDDLLFESVSPRAANKILQSIMPGITSKTFRTYNSSKLFQEKLDLIPIDLDQKSVLSRVKEANIEVARVCNHKKNCPNTNEAVFSLGTSKSNYIDPRIIVALSKKLNIPINKFMSKSLIKKFNWAMDVTKDWRF